MISALIVGAAIFAVGYGAGILSMLGIAATRLKEEDDG